MTRAILIVLGSLIASTSAFAQAGTAGDPALLAGPANLREGATIVRWNADYTHETLRKGTNRLVCYDISGMPGQAAFDVECTSIANLDRVAQNLRFEAEPDKAKRQAALEAAERDGSRAKPEFGSVWYHLRGPDRERARTHTTIAVPGATAASLGLPDNPSQGGVWIMDAGTSTAHLMTPGY
ncbi:MAG: hypothetical protein FJW23_15205 [Acidimicrobiia bacterium]|nr:hypothetical protein [Acidimicrobiia bacterium]